MIFSAGIVIRKPAFAPYHGKALWGLIGEIQPNIPFLVHLETVARFWCPVPLDDLVKKEILQSFREQVEPAPPVFVTEYDLRDFENIDWRSPDSAATYTEDVWDEFYKMYRGKLR